MIPRRPTQSQLLEMIKSDGAGFLPIGDRVARAAAMTDGHTEGPEAESLAGKQAKAALKWQAPAEMPAAATGTGACITGLVARK